MADVFSKKKRSAVMAAIKSRGTRTTELALRRLLRKSGLTGWRANFRPLPGTPDFAFPGVKLAVFVDGCFWHGCKRCLRHRRKPATNAAFWRKKVRNNIARDKRVNRRLNRMGWSVLRIWEHALEKDGASVIRRLMNKISDRKMAGR